jgi:hypothetical protein
VIVISALTLVQYDFHQVRRRNDIQVNSNKE